MSPKSVAELLPVVRQLFSERPEYFHHEPWELQWLLYALNYSDELEDEGAIHAGIQVARTDRTGEAA